MEFIKPIFIDLTKPELLRRCLKGKTQNANESYNNVLWNICPKKGFAGRTVLNIAAHEASLIYNEGHLGRLKVLRLLSMTPGTFCEESFRHFDALRVRDSLKRVENESLEARRARRRLRLDQQSRFEEVEGVTYAAGAF